MERHRLTKSKTDNIQKNQFIHKLTAIARVQIRTECSQLPKRRINTIGQHICNLKTKYI